MTIVNVDLMDVAKFRGNGHIRARSTTARPATTSTAMVTGEWHRYPITNGIAVMDLDPGPVEIQALMGGWSQTWTTTCPDSVDPITLVTLLDAYAEYPSEVVGQAQAARDIAITKAAEAASSAVSADAAADAAAATLAAVGTQITDAADGVRAEVADDADAAQAARTGAEVARTAAETARDTTLAARDTAVTARDVTTAARDTATAAKTSAETARDTTLAARDTTTAARDTATTAAATATTKAAEATASADDADTSKVAAQSAATDATAAKIAAQNSETIATTAATNSTADAGVATAAKNDAVAAKNAAQAAANSFGLSASASTLAPGSSATAAVSGTGPAYTITVGVPAGAKGDKGDQGSGLQLSGRVAAYANLPGGLNGTTDKGRAWIVNADGLLYIWDGSAFPAAGAGLNLVGAKGDPGDPGGPGPTGPAPNLSIGSVSQGAAAATVTGVSPNYTLNLTLPAGAKGDPGSTAWTDLTGKPSTFPPTIGSSGSDAKAGNWMPAWSDVSGKPSTFTPTTGTSGSVACAGNDPRLSDARTPTAHNHAGGDITSGTVAFARLPVGSGASQVAQGDHTHTKSQVGLGNVDNTADTAKPVSAAQQTALDAKAAIGYLPHDMVIGHTADDVVRATGVGAWMPSGTRAERAFTLERFRVWCKTADASGNLTVRLLKNGVEVSGTALSIAAGSQTSVTASAALSVAVADGDVLVVDVTGVGATPGKGLIAGLKGRA
jgi:hypothetical protein